jgi:hypothetical protein
VQVFVVPLWLQLGVCTCLHVRMQAFVGCLVVNPLWDTNSQADCQINTCNVDNWDLLQPVHPSIRVFFVEQGPSLARVVFHIRGVRAKWMHWTRCSGLGLQCHCIQSSMMDKKRLPHSPHAMGRALFTRIVCEALMGPCLLFWCGCVGVCVVQDRRSQPGRQSFRGLLRHALLSTVDFIFCSPFGAVYSCLTSCLCLCLGRGQGTEGLLSTQCTCSTHCAHCVCVQAEEAHTATYCFFSRKTGDWRFFGDRKQGL